MDKLQDRGKFFIFPGEEIYTGQVIGENSRSDDMVVNVTKTKKLTNIRSAGAVIKYVWLLQLSSHWKRHWNTSKKMNMWK